MSLINELSDISSQPESVEPTDKPSEFQKLMGAFFKKDKKIELKTELSDNEIKEIARLKFIFSALDISDMLNDFFKDVMVMRVSKDRKSRGEFFRTMNTQPQPTLPQDNLLDVDYLLRNNRNVINNPVRRRSLLDRLRRR